MVSERNRKAAETVLTQERFAKRESAVVTKTMKTTRSKLATATKRRKKAEVVDEQEERIYRAAIKYLLFNHGHLLVPTAHREMRIKGFPIWIFTVTLRYPTGFEGYVGDLLYDGENFTFLTEQSLMDERVRQIAANPERDRKWNEYRASTLRAGKG
jgi:hypothetical protein